MNVQKCPYFTDCIGELLDKLGASEEERQYYTTDEGYHQILTLLLVRKCLECTGTLEVKCDECEKLTKVRVCYSASYSGHLHFVCEKCCKRCYMRKVECEKYVW